MKRGLLAILFLAIFLIAIAGVFAADDFNLKFEGSINNLSSHLYLKTNPDSLMIFDTYDLKAPSSPTAPYALVYSSVNGDNLAIDSFDVQERTFNLTYQLSSSQSGTMFFNWTFLSRGNYDVTIIDFGNDSSYVSEVTSFNMASEDFYEVDVSSQSARYFQIVFTDDISPEIVIISPAASVSSSPGTISFIFTVTDSASDIDNCSLVINDALLVNSSEVSSGIQATFQKTLSEGSYSWKIQCYDAFGNFVESSERTLALDDTAEPYCGDGVCNGAETSSSCSQDCASGGWGGVETDSEDSPDTGLVDSIVNNDSSGGLDVAGDKKTKGNFWVIVFVGVVILIILGIIVFVVVKRKA